MINIAFLLAECQKSSSWINVNQLDPVRVLFKTNHGKEITDKFKKYKNPNYFLKPKTQCASIEYEYRYVKCLIGN